MGRRCVKTRQNKIKTKELSLSNWGAEMGATTALTVATRLPLRVTIT